MSDWEPFDTMENGAESNTENPIENPEGAAVTEENLSSIDTVEQKTVEDTYRAESTEAIYNTPSTEHIPAGNNNTHGLFSGIVQENSQEQSATGQVYGNGQEPTQPYGTEQAVDSQAYETQQAESSQSYESEQAGNSQPYGTEQAATSQAYGNGQAGNGQPYGAGQPGNSQPYGAGQWQGQPGNGQPYGNGQWQGQPGNGQPYGNGQPINSQPYGAGQAGNGQPYGNGQWQGQAGSGQPYGNGQWQGQAGNGQPYGVPPYGVPGNNPYSPYAVPQKKSHTGLIVGIIVAVVVLFLAALIALVYRVAQVIKEESAHSYQEESYNSDEDYNFDSYDDNDYNYSDNDDNTYGYDYDNEIDEGYTYDDDYDYDSDEYYTLHDDLKDNLSYSIDFDYVEYDSGNDNVYIVMGYPVISGKDVPNLDKINETLAAEIDQYIEYYEDTYKQYMTDEDDIFYAYINGYVAYMDEEKLSIVYNETVYGDYTEQAYLECINIDMENGIILDNNQMLSIDDDFSVEFRQKSDIQNGTISYLDSLTDQEITEYFKSRHIIVFYVPQGMEIGFNYEEGWVTVTYSDYEQYLKSF